MWVVIGILLLSPVQGRSRVQQWKIPSLCGITNDLCLPQSIVLSLSPPGLNPARWWMAVVSQGAFFSQSIILLLSFFFFFDSNFLKWSEVKRMALGVIAWEGLDWITWLPLSSASFPCLRVCLFVFLTFSAFFSPLFSADFNLFPSISITIFFLSHLSLFVPLSLFLSLSVCLSLSDSYQGLFEHCFHCDNMVLLKLIDCWLFLSRYCPDTDEEEDEEEEGEGCGIEGGVGVDLINPHLASGDLNLIYVTLMHDPWRPNTHTCACGWAHTHTQTHHPPSVPSQTSCVLKSPTDDDKYQSCSYCYVLLPIYCSTMQSCAVYCSKLAVILQHHKKLQ